MSVAYLNNLDAGDVLVVTGDFFTCLDQNTSRTVRRDGNDKLFINCNDGRHYLDGQEDDDGSLIGLELYSQENKDAVS